MADMIIAAAIVGSTISTAQGKDPVKGALYGAALGGVGAAVIGSSPKTPQITTGPIPKKETLATGPPAAASPRPQAVALESVKESERIKLRKRSGYMSTVLTKGGLGTATTQKQKVLGA